MGLLNIKREITLQDEPSRNGDGISIRPGSPLASATVKCAVSEDRLASTIRKILREEIRAALEERHQAKKESWSQMLRRMFQ